MPACGDDLRFAAGLDSPNSDPDSGAKRGPRPAHDVEIWVGAYEPRMLRLTGRVPDGRGPSVPAMEPGDLAPSNAIIDEAAREAGRPPADVRRLLNFGADPPVDYLVELALEHGISVFICETTRLDRAPRQRDDAGDP